IFITGIITARGLLLRTSARGALVVATSSARRTNSGRLLISIGVRCLRITRGLYHKTVWLLVGISEANFTYRTFCDMKCGDYRIEDELFFCWVALFHSGT